MFFLCTPSNSAQPEIYPQINVTGYKKYEYSTINVDPQYYFQATSLLGSPYSGGPWREKLKLNIIGKLTDKLSVSYDLQQDPDMPDRFDVKVTYDKTELTFGDFGATFTGNEFASTTKYLNGVMITSKDTWYDLLLVPSSKLKSNTQQLTSLKGTNSKGPYNLGHGSIIEDSERIELNNNILKRGVDYSIDYFAGKITFARILTQDDTFTYSYEYTNLIDLFFPTTSKRDFLGIRTNITIDPTLLGEPSRKMEKAIKQATEYFPSLLPFIEKKTTPEVSSSSEASTSKEAIVTPESISDNNEWESTGVYKLFNSPVIPYSEKITFMGTTLKKFEDYLISYQDGTITLLRPNLPSTADPMIVEYQYIDVATESEILPGSGKGPYALAYQDILDESESVYVNNIPFIRELDYKIDYKQGKVTFFTDIPSTANIVAKYKHLVVTTPPQSPKPVTPKSLKVGVTYLKESGTKGFDTPSTAVMETKSGKDISDNDNTLYLAYRPVTSSNEVEVRRNDTVLTYDVDYVFPTVEASTGNVIPPTKLAYKCDPSDLSDGLKTGTIKFLTTINATDEIDVDYNYSKWSADRYSGSGSSGTLTYYISNFRNLVPGAEEIQIWRKNVPNPVLKRLIRNSSAEVFDGHYRINYSDPPSITFNSDPIIVDGETFYLNDINFTVLFKFVAQASGSNRALTHDVVGFDTSFKVGDNLRLEGSFARSKTDQVYTSVTTNETFMGDGATKIFNLKSSGIINDGSERVYVNGQLLNRDNQYYFFYDSNSSGKYGALTFFSIIPASLDVISVDYAFQSSSGSVTTITEKQGGAYKLSAGLKPFNNLDLAADYKKVDFDFAPMGGTSIPLGSEYKHVYVKTTPLSNFWLSGDVKESITPISNYKDKFLSSYDRSLASSFNPYGIAQVDLGYRDFTTIDDKLPGATLHNNDYKSQSYTVSVAPTPLRYFDFGFINRTEMRKTISYTDTVDNNLPTDTISDYYHTNNAFDLTRRVRWVLDYQVNLPSTISYESGSRTKGKTITRNEIDDLSSNLNFDLTFANIKKLTTYWNKIGHNENNFIGGTLRSTVNETYHADFIPIDQVVTSIDHNRQEIPTISTAYGNPRSERSTANIRLTPYSNTILAWNGSTDDNLSESGAKTSGYSNNYSIDHTPISNSLYKLGTKYSLATSIRKAPLGTEPVVSTDSRTFIQDYGLTVYPTQSLTVTSGFAQEDYTNKNDSTASPVDTKSQSQTTRVGSGYKLTDDLNVSGNYSVKVTRTPNDSAHKSVLDAHAIYRFYINGTLNYDWSQEDNGGEILGGSFSVQDFTKVIQSFSASYVVDQGDQLLLSSILLRASIKWADYMDRANSDNSFKATLLTFEGTINF